MRVHVFSDLHLEFGPIEFSLAVRSGALADLVLLAGDIHTKRRAPAWAASTFAQPVAMIGGNHEAYGDSLYANIAASRKEAEQASANREHAVRFLERETWALTGADGTPVRIIAATWWTDFEAFGRDTRHRAMAQAHRVMTDFHVIRIRDDASRAPQQLEPEDLLRIHGASTGYIEDELAHAFDGITIVMTHHAPSLRSVAPQFRDDLLTAAYASARDDLIERYQPALWVHGHTHVSFDYRIGGTRVVCNPRGYAPDDLNPSFDPEFVVDVG